MGVGDGGAVGPDLDGGGLAVDVDRDGVPIDFGLDGEVREELDGQHPGLEGAVLLADQHAALAGDGEGLVGLYLGLDDRTGGVEGYGRNGGEGRAGGLGVDCGRCGKEHGAGHAGRAKNPVHFVVLRVLPKANILRHFRGL